MDASNSQPPPVSLFLKTHRAAFLDPLSPWSAGPRRLPARAWRVRHPPGPGKWCKKEEALPLRHPALPGCLAYLGRRPAPPRTQHRRRRRLRSGSGAQDARPDRDSRRRRRRRRHLPDTMPVPDPRGDAGRWANASARARMPNQPATTPRRRKRSWFYKCCRCCSGQADDGDWGPAPGEVPGARGTNPIIREGMLVVSGINMMSGRGGRNRCDHHTDEYEYDNLIVRRGQPFNIKLQFQQEYDPEDHRVCLEFLIGPTPQTSKGTHILVPMGTRLSDKSWGAELVETDGNSMTLKVTTSPTAVIGKYQFSVKTRSKAGEYPAPFDPRYEIYVLFNPWCSVFYLYLGLCHQAGLGAVSNNIRITVPMAEVRIPT
ncbi:protein-glutamine gamma-glutamyltransferase K [Sphaerodactylus townsendi]|uniref:protein-glutamine gamma-glutamyltransferase K n=1 Tax=Sphaerodactylus townsendi TaxID=933632 RepID=UPI002026A82C|nr:protein-glutamine gamma-glutamyltransferase K [Sphaerodactylus townsendi]